MERATGYFARRDGVVLTTFNLHGQFLEEQALPAILGVEAATAAARDAGLHGQLAGTDCTVFYDPTVAPGVSGKFRYVARPVPLRGCLFHPKLVIIAGRFAGWDALGLSRRVVGESLAVRVGTQRRVLRRDLDPHEGSAGLARSRWIARVVAELCKPG